MVRSLLRDSRWRLGTGTFANGAYFVRSESARGDRSTYARFGRKALSVRSRSRGLSMVEWLGECDGDISDEDCSVSGLDRISGGGMRAVRGVRGDCVTLFFAGDCYDR